MDWYRLDKGKTIGTKGSENGNIVDDIEHIDGVRITPCWSKNTAPLLD